MEAVDATVPAAALLLLLLDALLPRCALLPAMPPLEVAFSAAAAAEEGVWDAEVGVGG